mgnify:CR=1 FL=1
MEEKIDEMNREKTEFQTSRAMDFESLKQVNAKMTEDIEKYKKLLCEKDE